MNEGKLIQMLVFYNHTAPAAAQVGFRGLVHTGCVTGCVAIPRE